MSSILNQASLAKERRRYHTRLLEGVLRINPKTGVPSNADKNSRASVLFAQGIAEQLKSESGQRLAGQTSGSEFETINKEFIENTFLQLSHIRPGHWGVTKIGNRNRMAIAEFEQYSHLVALLEETTQSRQTLLLYKNYSRTKN